MFSARYRKRKSTRWLTISPYQKPYLWHNIIIHRKCYILVCKRAFNIIKGKHILLFFHSDHRLFFIFNNSIPHHHLVIRIFYRRCIRCHYVYKHLFRIPVKKWSQIFFSSETLKKLFPPLLSTESTPKYTKTHLSQVQTLQMHILDAHFEMHGKYVLFFALLLSIVPLILLLFCQNTPIPSSKGTQTAMHSPINSTVYLTVVPLKTSSAVVTGAR